VSRLRTGHGPNDWSPPDEGVPASLSGGAFLAGDLVRGEPGYAERERLRTAAKDNRRDFEPKPLCGHIMPRLNVPCARKPGHKDKHFSAATLIRDALRRRAA
jgi:hypothetical protein